MTLDHVVYVRIIAGQFTQESGSMATSLERAVVRETSVIDYRSNKPLIIKLEAGGKLVRLKVKGERTWYTVTVHQLWMLGAQNKIEEERQAKAAARALKKAERG